MRQHTWHPFLASLCATVRPSIPPPLPFASCPLELWRQSVRQRCPQCSVMALGERSMWPSRCQPSASRSAMLRDTRTQTSAPCTLGCVTRAPLCVCLVCMCACLRAYRGGCRVSYYALLPGAFRHAPTPQVLARACAATGLFAAVEACALDGDPGRPALLLTPAPGAAEALLHHHSSGAAPLAAPVPAAAPGSRRPRASSTASDASARSAASADTVARQGRVLGGWRLRVIPCLDVAPASPIAKWPAHLVPHWNNARPQTLLQHSGRASATAAPDAPGGGGGGGGGGDAGPPTPHYNALLLRDACVRSLHAAFAAALGPHAGAAAAATVLKDWWAGRWCVRRWGGRHMWEGREHSPASLAAASRRWAAPDRLRWPCGASQASC